MAANEEQVGGSHYRSAIQHWDFVIANGLGYFEGQITKYLTRWRKKNGLQDLMKARHFLDKLIEMAEEEEADRQRRKVGAPPPHHPGAPPSSPTAAPAAPAGAAVAAAAGAGAPLPQPRPPLLLMVPAHRVRTWNGFTFEGSKGEVVMYQCNACGEHVNVLGLYDPLTAHGTCAGRTYVAP